MDIKAPAPKRLESEYRPISPTIQEESAQPVPLAVLSPPHAPWDTHLAESRTVAEIYATAAGGEFQRYADRIGECSQELTFRIQCDDTRDDGDKWVLHHVEFCHVRHCPKCQWRKSLKLQARFYEAIPQIVEAHPRARWVFLTLTVRNCDVSRLRATLKEMNAGWKRLIDRVEFGRVLGWVRSTEVTRNPDDASAHPHFHVLLMVSPEYFKTNYVPQARWAEAWKECARLNYSPVVDVRAIKPRKSKKAGRKRKAVNPVEMLRAAVPEVLKYSTKAADLTADGEWLVEMTRQVHRCQFIASGGALKGLFKDMRQKPDPETVQANEETDCGGRLVADCRGGKERYYRDRLASDLATASAVWRVRENARQRRAVAEKKSAPAFGGNEASGERISGAAPSAEN